MEKEIEGKTEPDVVEITGFRVVNVFALEQTDGKELPAIGVDELTGDVDGYHKFFDALKDICPVPICAEDIQGGAKGYYDDAAKLIAIQSGMSQMQTIKTMLHEISHQKLHAKEAMDKDNPLDRNTIGIQKKSKQRALRIRSVPIMVSILPIIPSVMLPGGHLARIPKS